LTAVGQLADELRRIGRRAGLDGVGICEAGPFAEARVAIDDRLQSGASAGMQFTFRQPHKSTDPRTAVPDARAVFVGARSYLLEEPARDWEGPAARIARYAWIEHYRPLREALGEVAARLKEAGYRARVLADDNALVDRAAAVRAGIGWYGKNANVLIPGHGSWFVLGAVVTDAPIAPMRAVQAVADGCGTCRRCLGDCPTGALTAPGHLDGRRCLAWLLQAKGPFPPQFREALGDRLYGCDECQERCPENRRVMRAGAARPAPAGTRSALPVLDVLEADDEDLTAMVGRWYIPGRDLDYVRRNALVVLGNIGEGDDPQAAAALARYLAHPNPLLRAHAVWAADRLGRTDLLAAVNDDDPMVAEELARLGR
jgi:epoxyqueuosine reductase